MTRYSLIVINQSPAESDQRLLESLSEQLGPSLLITGAPYEAKSSCLKIDQAPSYQRSSIRLRVLSWVDFCLNVLWKVFLIRRPSLLLVTTNPPFLLHLALLLNILRGWRFVFLAWDLYPQHLVSSSLLSANNPIVKAWHYLNGVALRRASLVIAISDGMSDEIITSEQSVLPKIRVIPNFAITDRIRPISKAENPFAMKYGLCDKLVVLYSGNIGQTHDLEPVLLSAARLEQFKDLVFLFIGDGLGKERLVNKASELKLNNLLFLPMQDEDMLPFSLTSGDVAIVSQSTGTHNYSLPSKTYSYMAAGCALLAIGDRSSDLSSFVTNNSIGIATLGDPESIFKAIEQLVKDRGLLSTMQKNSREISTSRYDIEQAKSAWLDALRTVCSN